MLEINKIHHGDCLELMKDIPSGTVDLILTDPPYGTMNGAELDGWKGNKTSWDNAINPQKLFNECERILREKGTLILFSQEPYTSKLIINSHKNLPFNYRLIWLKDHFANALISKVAPVSYFEDILVFQKKYDVLNQNPLREYAMKVMLHIGKGLKQINSELGHRKAEHFFYLKSTQFKLCTKEIYVELTEKYKLVEMEGYLDFQTLEDINNKYRPIFNLPQGEAKKSNVLSYKKDYGGLHPTQKPIALLKDLIKTYSNKGALILDFTCGSGSTNVACELTKRNHIGIELDEKYFEIAKRRIEEHSQQSTLLPLAENSKEDGIPPTNKNV